MSNQNPNLTAGMNGGMHVSGAPLTTDLANAAAPGLLTNDIDRAIVKIRPMATPLDQISRLGHVRQVSSLDVDYFSVDSRGDRTKVLDVRANTSGNAGSTCCFVLSVEDPSIFEPSEAFTFTDDEGTFHSGYVVAKKDEKLHVICADGALEECPDAEIIRLGRAATQLDVQSPQFSVLPKRNTNYCQIFKMQIEQSVIMKLSHKEIGWDFTDQQEAAVYDMRLGMEKQFLFGKLFKVFDYEKNENVTMTEGVWHQAGKDIQVKLAGFDSKALIDMLRSAFTENSGSRRKVLIAGSELIAAINKLEATRVITSRDQETHWGIDFSVLCSKFGKLYVVFSDIFDSMGMASDGIIIDPEYIQKHVFIPFSAERLDLRGSGQRNTEALVLTEASCLTLRYPEAHSRVRGV